MKRKLHMVIIIGMLFAIAGCRYQKSNGNLELKDNQVVMLRLAETMPEEHPSARTMRFFAQLVQKRSEGRVKIKIYYDGSLGTSNEIIEQMKFGGIAMARVNTLELTEQITSLQSDFEPEKFTSAEEVITWIRENKEKLKDVCQTERITPLIWYYPDLRCFYSSDIPVLTKADLSGKKVQATDCQLMTSVMDGMGAEVIGSTNTDIYKSLSSGSIDCAESAFGEFICNDYDQYIHYVTISDYVFFPDVVLINTECLTSLSKEDRKIVENCAKATYEYQKTQMKKFQEKWQQKLKENQRVSLQKGDFR